MSRLAGAKYSMDADQIGRRADISKWSVNRDWTVVFAGGPLDGTMRRTPNCQSVYERKIVAGDEIVVDLYRATGYAPYQRVAFAKYEGKQDGGRVGRSRVIHGTEDIKRYMIEDGDL